MGRIFLVAIILVNVVMAIVYYQEVTDISAVCGWIVALCFSLNNWILEVENNKLNKKLENDNNKE